MAVSTTLGPIVVPAVAFLLLSRVTWMAYQSRERPSARPFLVLVGALAAWALFGLGGALVDAVQAAPETGLLELGPIAIGIVIPGVWTIYVLTYTGFGGGLTRRRVVMLVSLALPLIGAGVILAVQPPTTVAERLLASLAGLELLLIGMLVIYTTYRFLAHGWNHARISRTQLALVWSGVGAPYLVGVFVDPVYGIDSYTIGLLCSGGLLWVAIRRYPVLTGFPKADYVARARVVEALQEMVIVLDWEDHILDVNETATAFADRSGASMLGRPVEVLFAGLSAVDLGAGATGTVTLETGRGRRQFQYSVSAVQSPESGSTRQGAPVARAVLLRDVTDRQTREQRLAVLNRVLRHNVRNEVDVILAHADRVESQEHRDAIYNSAKTILNRSQKARTAEEIIDAGQEPPEPVDLIDCLESVVETMRDQYPDSEITVTGPASLVLFSHKQIIEQMLTELIDNAISHAKESIPSVDIRVRIPKAETAKLEIADTGPGIPERERTLLAEGTETQFEHGLGLGLWIVNWAALQLGADLSFEDRSPSGTLVTVQFHTVMQDSLQPMKLDEGPSG